MYTICVGNIFLFIFDCYVQTVSKFGGIDILVSNAAVNPAMGGVLDVSS